MKILGRSRKGCLKGLNWTLWWLKRTIGGGKGLFLVWKDYWWWRRTIACGEGPLWWWKMENMENRKYWKMENMENGEHFASGVPQALFFLGK